MKAVPAGPLLFDTGIYIRSSRGEDYRWLVEDEQIFERTFLTAVVAGELYAGTRDRHEKKDLDGLCRAYDLLGHFISPAASAWLEAGILIRRAQSVFGQIDFAHHFRDALIAGEAARAGATLVTENSRDFERWQTLLASSGKKLRVFNPS
jgi:predicted nucleic acid-binding protein